ncbi:MAG: hypothetical protein L3K26_15975 [Candidatus Hydrogenedentes bacterium]|nr:hypothetical protein [Candidatus Hydrogenedentota bacterium]
MIKVAMPGICVNDVALIAPNARILLRRIYDLRATRSPKDESRRVLMGRRLAGGEFVR